MKNTRILIFLVLLTFPILGRLLWFYQGIYVRSQAVTTPDYASLTLPMPDISTPEATTKSNLIENYVVLIDFEHGNNFVLAEIENLTQPITQSGAKLEISNFDLPLSERLKYCNAYVVIAPTYSFVGDEIRAIIHFVQRGGKLLVIADPTRNYYTNNSYSYDGATQYLSGADVANLLLAPFEIAFAEDYLYNLVENEANYRNVFFTNFNDDALTNDLSKIALYGAHSIQTTQKVLISGDENTLSSLTDQGGELAVAATTENGGVLAMGDMNFLTSPYYQVADNQHLLNNVIQFLLGATRTYDLADFPYLFHRTVSVLTPGKDVMDRDLVTTLSEAQLSLRSLDLSIEVTDTPTEGNDLLVSGTYRQREDLEIYLKPFDLEFSKEPIVEEENYGSILDTPEPTMTPFLTDEWNFDTETQDAVMVPGLGKFAVQDVGLILFQSTPERNTLTLLASNSEALKELTSNVFNYRDLSRCLIADSIAVCNLDSGGDSSDYVDENSGFGFEGDVIDDESTVIEPPTFTPDPYITPVGLQP